ncbi:MAG: sialate O-acetylesterase [Balneola sp.]|nr:sialate O-acetylesterase [Balneola sp.]|tara:strand:- start:91110 stop:93035 length:1926 start_codon:yes stop_codon:yes gene_type:complete
MRKVKLILVFILLPLTLIQAQVELPKLISNGMVLQRDTELTIWGWATPGEEVMVSFRDQKWTTQTNNSGNWYIQLGEQSAGGPFSMEITASNSITIQDILVGDVWLASGQSNMELPMYRVAPLYREEMKTANYPEIRHFKVPQEYSFEDEKSNYSGGQWVAISPETISQRSAVAYFFSKKLHEDYEVPIGIVNASLGGSPAEAWMDEDALKEFPHYHQEALIYKDEEMREKIAASDQARNSRWHEVSVEQDRGYQNEHWANPEVDDSGWKTMSVPGYWNTTSLGNINGVVWFRKEIDVPESMAGKEVELELGRVVDADSTFVNGEFVGNVTYQYPPRWYTIPEGVLKAGKNTIAVRVINQSGNGGFFYDKRYEIRSETDTLDLKGKWKMMLGVQMPSLPGQTFIRWKPVGLFNGMIAPALNYEFKGAIWYQGESNVGAAEEYKTLFPAMIQNWRERFNEPGFPFVYVQLANFMRTYDDPTESGWALLREAQFQTLELPKTGMAVAIDIGEWNDIHPLNKRTVGERLAISAKGVAYGEDIVYSGPIYESMEVKGDRVEISFSSTGSGLVTKDGGPVQEVAIAGSDKEFKWAQTKIEGNKLIVWHEDISDPVAVRYAWSDNPDDANLYNEEGLPASPFRTDDW